MMYVSTATLTLYALLAALCSADLHADGVCIDKVGGQNVYNDAATKAACTSYFRRNTGGEHWDQCPDCAMVRLGSSRPVF